MNARPDRPSDLSFYQGAQEFEAFHQYTSYYRHLRHVLVSLVQAQPGQLIVEWGSANGETCRALAEQYPESQVVGIDWRSESVEAARRASDSKQYPNLRFHAADITALETYLPINKQYPAVICSLYALHQIPDPIERKLTFLEQVYDLPVDNLRIVTVDNTTEYEAEDPEYAEAVLAQRRGVAEEGYRSVFLNRYLELIQSGIPVDEAREVATLAGEYVRQIELQIAQATAARYAEYPLSTQEMTNIWLEAGFSIDIVTQLNPFRDMVVVATKRSVTRGVSSPGFPWEANEC